jgi:hypothetical protein
VTRAMGSPAFQGPECSAELKRPAVKDFFNPKGAGRAVGGGSAGEAGTVGCGEGSGVAIMKGGAGGKEGVGGKEVEEEVGGISVKQEEAASPTLRPLVSACVAAGSAAEGEGAAGVASPQKLIPGGMGVGEGAGAAASVAAVNPDGAIATRSGADVAGAGDYGGAGAGHGGRVGKAQTPEQQQQQQHTPQKRKAATTPKSSSARKKPEERPVGQPNITQFFSRK